MNTRAFLFLFPSSQRSLDGPRKFFDASNEIMLENFNIALQAPKNFWGVPRDLTGRDILQHFPKFH